MLKPKILCLYLCWKCSPTLQCGPAKFWCWSSCGAPPVWPSSCQTCSSSTEGEKSITSKSHWKISPSSRASCTRWPVRPLWACTYIISPLWVILVCPCEIPVNAIMYRMLTLAEVNLMNCAVSKGLGGGGESQSVICLFVPVITTRPHTAHCRHYVLYGLIQLILTVFTAVMKFIASSLTFSCSRPNLLS